MKIYSRHNEFLPAQFLLNLSVLIFPPNNNRHNSVLKFFILLFEFDKRSYCACGNTINYPCNTLPDSSCNEPCSGNPTIDLKCGASEIISIYNTALTTNSLNLVQCPKGNSFYMIIIS